MISVFNGYSWVIHGDIAVPYFIRHDNGYKPSHTLPGRPLEHFDPYFDDTVLYGMSYIKINGNKYGIDNTEKNFARIQMPVEREKTAPAVNPPP